MKKEQEVLDSEQILRDYDSGDRQTWVDAFIEDREFYFGEQFSENAKQSYAKRGLMAAAINESLPAVDQIIADLTSNNPRFTAVAVEDSDVKPASHIAKLLDWIFYNSKGTVKVEKFVRDFCVGGIGYIMVYPDYSADNGKGELKIIDLDPIHVYLSQASKEPDGSDSAHIVYSDILSEDVIKVNWEGVDLKKAEKKDNNKYARQRAQTQSQIIFSNKFKNVNHYEVIDRYTKVKVSRYHVYDPNKNFERTFEKKQDYEAWRNEQAIILVELNGSRSYSIDDIEVERYLEIYQTIGDTYHLMSDKYGQPELMPGIEHDSPYVIPGSTVQIQIITKGSLVDDGIISYEEPKVDRIKRVFSIGGLKVVDEILPISNYPIVASMLHHNRNPYASGDIRLIKPLQEQLNVLDQRIQAYLRNITTLRAITNSGSGLKKKIDESGHPMDMEIYETDLETQGAGIVFPQYPPLPAGIMQQRENIIRQIQRIIGAYSFQDGESVAAPRTASGTTQIDEFMRRRSAYKKRKIEASLEQLAKVISEYIPYIYNQRKIVRLISPNRVEALILNQEQEVDGSIKVLNDTTTYKFDIRIISGSMLPLNREQERAEIMRAYELGMLRNPKWWIEKSNFEDADQMLEEENMITELQQVVQQTQETIKDLKAQLQTKMRENIQMNEKVEVQKTKTALDKIKNKAESNVMTSIARMKDAEKLSKQLSTQKKEK